MTEVKTAEKYEHAASEAQPLRVCFVCTGNTCRSPMAAAVANHLAAKELESYPASIRAAMMPRLVAQSRGLYPNEGEPIAQNAVAALEAAEILPVADADYRVHTAKGLAPEDGSRFDLLVAMSGTHAMELMMRFPGAANKIVCMPHGVFDPYGGDIELYRACLAEIEAGVRALLFETEPHA